MDVHRKIAVYVLLVGFLSAIVVAPDRHLRIEHAHGDQHLRHLRLSNGPHKQSNFSTQEDAPEDTHSQAQEETRFQFEICPYVLTGPEPINHIQKWLDFVDLLAREVEDADETEGWDVVFYGDSIFEMFRGSSKGTSHTYFAEYRDIFLEYFHHSYQSHVLAISGDQVGHLWWRLLHGELPVKRHPKAVVILIGTNDMSFDDCNKHETASLLAAMRLSIRVSTIVDLLREALPDTEILLLGLLPRDAILPPAPRLYEWPNRMTQGIHTHNSELQVIADNTEKVNFLDCGHIFIEAGGGIKGALMPDALHPGPEGMRLLAACLQPELDRLVFGPQDSEDYEIGF